MTPLWTVFGLADVDTAAEDYRRARAEGSDAMPAAGRLAEALERVLRG